VGGYPDAWTRYEANIDFTGAGRIAFRYFVTDGGPSGSNSNYIGIDTVEVTSDTGWEAVTSLNTPRSRPAMAFFPQNGRYYVLGGESFGNRDIPIEEYDLKADTWTNRANLLVGVSNTGAATVGGYIYVPGGYDGSIGRNEMQRFNPLANSVSLMAPMPKGNSAHAVVAAGKRVYVLGGSASGPGTTNYFYDTEGDSWAAGSPVPTPVSYAAAAYDGTYIYLVGGTGDSNAVQRYNPLTDQWDTAAPMLTGRAGPAAFYDGTRLWVVGGGWNSYLSSTEYYQDGTWIIGPTMNTGVRTVAAAYGKGVALKAGGYNGSYSGAAEKLVINRAFPWPMFLPAITHSAQP